MWYSVHMEAVQVIPTSSVVQCECMSGDGATIVHCTGLVVSINGTNPS